MRVTVYLPDALAEKVRASGINVSRTCQTALREALETPLTPEQCDAVENALPKLLEALEILAPHLRAIFPADEVRKRVAS